MMMMTNTTTAEKFGKVRCPHCPWWIRSGHLSEGQVAKAHARHLASHAPLDSRPRRDYILPDLAIVTIILDHGEVAPNVTTFQLASGQVVSALLVEIR